MASMREIKNKVEATKKTSQITKAMNMVSASKLRKAERKFRGFLPIMGKVKTMLSHVLSTHPDITHPLLESRSIQKTGYILVSSDRGLAGPYNANLFKFFEQHVKEHHTSKEEYLVATIGYKAYSYCKRKKYPLVNTESINSRDEVQFIDFQAMSRTFISMYLQRQVDQIVLIYSHFVNTLTQEVKTETLLPMSGLILPEGTQITEYLFEPSPEDVLNQLFPIYLENTLYGVILDAKTSEHASRMTAMKNATDNAVEVIQKQQLVYNRARQAAITIELTDIIGGANAVS